MKFAVRAIFIILVMLCIAFVERRHFNRLYHIDGKSFFLPERNDSPILMNTQHFKWLSSIQMNAKFLGFLGKIND